MWTNFGVLLLRRLLSYALQPWLSKRRLNRSAITAPETSPKAITLKIRLPGQDYIAEVVMSIPEGASQRDRILWAHELTKSWKQLDDLMAKENPSGQSLKDSRHNSPSGDASLPRED